MPVFGLVSCALTASPIMAVKDSDTMIIVGIITPNDTLRAGIGDSKSISDPNTSDITPATVSIP